MTVYKVAQRWQTTFPFKDIEDKPHGHESLISYTGTMNGSPYWACRICGKPVLNDLTGQPITRKEHLPGYLPGESIPEEQSTGYVFTQQEYENIRNKFSEYIPKCIALVNKCFEHILNFTNNEIDYTPDTSNIIHELFQKLLILNIETKDSLLTALSKIDPMLKDKGVTKDDVSILYQLFANINPDFYQFWPSYRIPQYIPPNSPPQVMRDAGPPYEYSKQEGNRAEFEAKKNEIINYISKYGPTLEKILNEYAAPYIGIEGVRRAEHEVKLHPICQTCFDENSYHCDEKDCDFVTLDENDLTTVTKTEWVQDPQKTNGGSYVKQETQFCEQHGTKCDSCGKGLEKEDNDIVKRDNYYYHSDCYSEIFTTCEECNEEIYAEDARYDEDNGVTLCADCYDNEGERKAGIEQGIPEEDLDTAKEMLQNQDKFFPLEADAIQKSILPTVQLAIKHVSKNPIRPPNEKDYNDIESFIHKRLQKPETKAVVSVKLQDLYTQAVPSTRTTEVDWGQIMNNMEAFFIKNLEEVNRIKTEYPNLKGFKPYPVDIKIESGKNHGGSVFVIYPSEEFLNYAEIIQPGAKEAYDNHIERKGHHRGALAYARFTLSKGNIIIDNLQTDIDAQAFHDQVLKSTPALQWWTSTIKKFWVPYLLDALRKFGQSVEKKIYLTNFDMQKIKWHSIPERSKDIYDRIPETMNMPAENVEARPEDLTEKKWHMRRVARKLLENTEEFIRLATE